MTILTRAFSRSIPSNQSMNLKGGDVDMKRKTCEQRAVNAAQAWLTTVVLGASLAANTATVNAQLALGFNRDRGRRIR